MIARPLWSVMIPTFNAEKYLTETLESVLEQNIAQDRMEIVVVDNQSTDNTENIVKSVGKGKVKWIQNETNVGMFNNFNKCIKYSNGKYIHILNADDLVKEGFYDSFEKAFNHYPEVGLVSCECDIIDDYSIVTGSSENINSFSVPSNDLEEMLYVNPFRTPGVVVKKEAYKVVGYFDNTFTHVADWDMWIRVIHNLKGVHINEKLCKYRVSTINATSKSFIEGKDLLDLEKLFFKLKEEGHIKSLDKHRNILKEHSKWQYGIIYMYHRDKPDAVRNLRKICTRYNSSWDMIKIDADLNLGMLKRKFKDRINMILGRRL